MKFSMMGKKWAKTGASILVAGAMVGAMGLAGCTANTNNGSSSTTTTAASSDSEAADGVIEVTITDDSCTVSANSAKSGTVTFNVTNNGTAVNEFEILAEDQLQIVTERENITPGTSVEVTAILEPGNYYTASKTNMVGALVSPTAFTVEDSGEEVQVSDNVKELQEKAVTNYTAYIKDQAGQLVDATDTFLEAYESGDTEKAKELYALTRMYYERVEPTAESFGDIDPNLDLREADAKAGDIDDMADWKGWHAIEKDLWEPKKADYSDKQRKALAKALKEDTKAFYDLVYSDDFEVSLTDITNGAISLMEEVATSKITGEEEAFSHTDLYDFQANVEGAKVAYGNVKDILEINNPDSVTKIDAAFESIEKLLAEYNTGDTKNPVYPDYTEIDPKAGAGQSEENLSKKAIELSDGVDALRSALAKLSADVTSTK